MTRRPLWKLGWVLLAYLACEPPLPKLTVDPSSVDFGIVPLGSSASRTITVKSLHDKEVTLSLPAPYGYNPEALAIALPDPPRIPAHGTISLTATYTPHLTNSTAYFTLIGSGDGDDDRVSITLLGAVPTIAICSPPDADGGTIIGNSFGAVETGFGQEGWSCSHLDQPDPFETPCQNTNSCQYYCCACPTSCAQYQATACMADGCASKEVACAAVRTFFGIGPMLCPPDGTDAGAGNSLSGEMAFPVESSGVSFPQSGDGGPDLSTLTIELARGPSPIFCPAGSDGGAYEIDIHLRSTTGPIVPGIYTVGVGASLICNVALIDTDGGNAPATSGNVVLTAVSPTGVEGAFSGNLVVPRTGNVSALSGTFEVPFCGYSP